LAPTPKQWLARVEPGDAKPTRYTGIHDAPGREARLAARLRELNNRHLLVWLRQQAQLTQQEVADRLGQTRPAVSQAENRPLETMAVGTFIRHIDALGYRLDLESSLVPVNQPPKPEPT